MELTETTSGSDLSLVERAQRGDHRAFGELTARHDRRLRAVAFRLLRDPDRVDDALQDTYLKAFRRLDGFRRDADVATWLYRITYNTCLDELRRRPVVLASDDQLECASREPGPADRVVTCFEAAAALDRLSPELRRAVVLVDGYGFDYAEAARLLGVPPGTVGSRLNRARTSLRRQGEVAADAA